METGVGEEERNGMGIGMMEERVKSGEEEKLEYRDYDRGRGRRVVFRWWREKGLWAMERGETYLRGEQGVEEEVETRVRMENLDFRE